MSVRADFLRDKKLTATLIIREKGSGSGSPLRLHIWGEMLLIPDPQRRDDPSLSTPGEGVLW